MAGVIYHNNPIRYLLYIICLCTCLVGAALPLGIVSARYDHKLNSQVTASCHVANCRPVEKSRCYAGSFSSEKCPQLNFTINSIIESSRQHYATNLILTICDCYQSCDYYGDIIKCYYQKGRMETSLTIKSRQYDNDRAIIALLAGTSLSILIIIIMLIGITISNRHQLYQNCHQSIDGYFRRRNNVMNINWSYAKQMEAADGDLADLI